MTIEIIMLITGIAGIFFSIRFLTILKKSNSEIINQTTFNNNVDRAQIESGIYIEHGMTSDSHDKIVISPRQETKQSKILNRKP